MKAIRQLVATLIVFIATLAISISAETTASSLPVITGSATAERVRFVGVSGVVRMKVEVFSASGVSLFEASSKGNVFDWPIRDRGGERIADGTYVCVVTVKSLSGKLSQRIGNVTLSGGRAELNSTTNLSAAQQAAIGPVEEHAFLTVLTEKEMPNTTTVAHDGKDGQVTSTTGALTFRTGDVFSGTETRECVSRRTDGSE
jgi:hypothetical protein